MQDAGHLVYLSFAKGASMVTTPKNQGPVEQITKFTIGAASAATVHIATWGRKNTVINIDKNGESVTTPATVDRRKVDGSIITDIEDAEMVYSEVDSGTDDYFAGGNKGITGFEIQKIGTSSAVHVSITQYND